ncbi:hypothetical protein IR073_05170 [Gemella sp. 19428wG2_WT2a]|nr:hypothetical protein [Gemella sp. 19428wG2_WT2a]TFU58850.1 hypothetical protein E4T67_05135 [Gemella sp. WT2a]
MKNTDRILKILIVIATFIILSTLAVMAFLNFSGDNKSSNVRKTQDATTIRQISSTSEQTSTTSEKEETSTSSEDESEQRSALTTSMTRSTANVARTTERVTSQTVVQTTSRPTESVKTQANISLEEAIKENANEDRGEREESASAAGSSRTFSTQAQAHAYGVAEINRIAKENKRAASYVVKAIRDASGKVTGWQADIIVD